ncbi:MAG: HpcH/HpaI aldolase family protein [Opitutaceae bacterium]
MRAGRVQHAYVLGNHATPRHVDFVGATGLFETLWFDLEHFDIPTDQLAVLNLVARAHPVTTLARFHATNYERVQRVLETGVGGIMCAMVESPEEAAAIVRWSKFNNPEPAPGEAIGLRGWNAGGIDARYGTVPAKQYVSHQNREIAILCQIETREALAAVDEIVSVKGVDAIFFGPGDYAHRIGCLGQFGHAEVLSAMSNVAEACKRAGKWWGTVGIGKDHYRSVRALGAQLICPGGDVRVMLNGINQLAETFRDQV